jgi:hypothetical protein
LLEELYGAAGIPDELGSVLDELFGVPTPGEITPNEGGQA